MIANIKILIADDEKVFCEIFKDLFAGQNCKVFSTCDPDDVVKIIVDNGIDLVLLDKRFPRDGKGIEVLKKIKKENPDIQVIMMTSYPDADSSHEALREGVSGYFIKTDDYGTIRETVKSLIAGIESRKSKEIQIKKLEIAKKTLSDWNSELVKKLEKLDKKS